MAAGDDILEHYGPEISYGQRAWMGGITEAKPLAYDPPKGPIDQFKVGPGLGGAVFPCGTQARNR